MNHKEYLAKYIGKRVDFDAAYWYQCVDLARHYCWLVWNYLTGTFWGSAYAGWQNRAKTFNGKPFITWFPSDSKQVPVWSIVIFKADADVEAKNPWPSFKNWRKIKFWKAGHVAIVDYIDNDGVMRVLEQNGINGRLINGTRVYDGIWSNAIRLMWYKWKDSVAWFILQ